MATHSLPLIATTAAPLYSEICSGAEKRGEGTTITRGQTLAPLRTYDPSARSATTKAGIETASPAPRLVAQTYRHGFLYVSPRPFSVSAHRSTRPTTDRRGKGTRMTRQTTTTVRVRSCFAQARRAKLAFDDRAATTTMRATSFPRAGPTYLFPEEGSLPSSLSLLRVSRFERGRRNSRLKSREARSAEGQRRRWRRLAVSRERPPIMRW